MMLYENPIQINAREHLKDLCEIESGLSEWEIGFIDGCVRTRGDGFIFSEFQIEKIYEIYVRKDS